MRPRCPEAHHRECVTNSGVQAGSVHACSYFLSLFPVVLAPYMLPQGQSLRISGLTAKSRGGQSCWPRLFQGSPHQTPAHLDRMIHFAEAAPGSPVVPTRSREGPHAWSISGSERPRESREERWGDQDPSPRPPQAPWPGAGAPVSPSSPRQPPRESLYPDHRRTCAQALTGRSKRRSGSDELARLCRHTLPERAALGQQSWGTCQYGTFHSSHWAPHLAPSLEHLVLFRTDVTSPTPYAQTAHNVLSICWGAASVPQACYALRCLTPHILTHLLTSSSPSRPRIPVTTPASPSRSWGPRHNPQLHHKPGSRAILIFK